MAGPAIANPNVRPAIANPNVRPLNPGRTPMEHHHWEEEIDVDDTDLPSLVHPAIPPPKRSFIVSNPNPVPSLLPCSQLSRPSSQTLAPNPSTLPPPPPPPQPRAVAYTVRRIPGPAGAVQASMRRRAAAEELEMRRPRIDSRGHVETRCDRGVDSDGEVDDEDFELNPWLCAMSFLGPTFPSSIDSIKNQKITTERISRVVGIVKSCKQNGLGDLFITLKDPSGMIGASVHGKVLSECNLLGDICVGVVLILKQVVVFCPAPSVHYLNVTTNNVEKLISKDCGPPGKQMPSPYAVTCRASGTESRGNLLKGAERTHTQRQEVGSAREDTLRQMFNHKRMTSDKDAAGPAGRVPFIVNTGLELPENALSERQGAVCAAENETIQNSTSNRNAGIPAGILPCSINDGPRASQRTPTETQGARSAASHEPSRNFNFERMLKTKNPGVPANVSGTVERASSQSQVLISVADDEAKQNSYCEMMIDHSDKDPPSLSSTLPSAVNAPDAANIVQKSGLITNASKKLISKESVGQWTDEQLLELFSDYPDDADMACFTI